MMVLSKGLTVGGRVTVLVAFAELLVVEISRFVYGS